jgi:hypothetical protein
MMGSVSTGFRGAHAATAIGRSLPQFMLQCNNYLMGITRTKRRGGPDSFRRKPYGHGDAAQTASDA